MSTVRDLAADPEFRRLTPEAQRIVVDRVASEDKEFQGLDSEAQQVVRTKILQPPPPPTELTTAQQIVRGSALSIAGGAVGTAIGSLPPVIAVTGGVVNPVTGAMLGSGAGEAVTQFFDPLKSGVQSPSALQIGAATALPGVPAALRRFFMSLPGAAAGLQEFLFGRLGNKAEMLVSRFAPPPGTAKGLFEQARREGAAVTVPVTTTSAKVAELAKEVSASQFATGPARTIVKRAEEFVRAGSVPFDEFRLNQSDLGALVRSLERKGGAALGRSKALYASMWDDLDRAIAGGQLGTTLTNAIDAFKREEAAAFFKNYFLGSMTRRVGRQNIDVDALMTKVDRNRDVLERLMPSEAVDDVLVTLKSFANIPVMEKTGRVGLQPMPFSERVVVGGAVGGIGHMAGFGGDFFSGAAGGVLAVEALSMALASPPGRGLVRMMASQGATIDQIANALLQGGRSAFSPTDQIRLNAGR